ncbi:flagellar protein FlgN [Neobacillus muris]|uniref:flagellar protein FlgN n=1 Tax=Neobacillus muris TaxID=2941334 RepID=UPI002040894A|nr:flagellar protein FlgN [Neobacillus muris]
MEDLNQLTQLLERMIEVHTRLLDLAKEKRGVLVAGDIQDIQSLLFRESSCTDEIQKLEQRRKQLVQEYMEQRGMTGHSFTLEEVVKLPAEPSIKARLDLIAKQLRYLVQEISQVNESNQQLIQTSLSYIQYAMSLYVPKEQEIGYGQKRKKQYASLLDAKI